MQKSINIYFCTLKQLISILVRFDKFSLLNLRGMFYSHSIENDKIGLFTSFVKSILEGRSEYKSVVDNVISEAHALASGEKNFYNIDRDSFPVIVFLEEKDPDFFKEVDFRSSSTLVYNRVLDLLSEQKPVSIY